mmetsp:Transcript_820/g.2136  ORF Transcript_820/g.2136 Transcript_820/m.2136 type:complete len:110 (-) Transcript_820:434-763(-)
MTRAPSTQDARADTICHEYRHTLRIANINHRNIIDHASPVNYRQSRHIWNPRTHQGPFMQFERPTALGRATRKTPHSASSARLTCATWNEPMILFCDPPPWKLDGLTAA